MPENQLSYERVFGPVPSRRLGRSLGINNIPPKICSYACVYCQLGNALGMTNQRGSFFDPHDLAREVTEKVRELRSKQELIDYLTIVPDGEPTLDLGLGQLINLLRPLEIKIAVISNASLIHLPEVRDALQKADWVSLKVDSTQEQVWKKIDRPHGKIHLSSIREGMKSFAREFKGSLVTETMLVRGLNDGAEDLQRTASFLRQINPCLAYLGIPTRPPAEVDVAPPTERGLNQAFQIFREAGLNVEYLIGYEGDEFSSTGDIEQDLLSITSVHPMREDAVEAFLAREGQDSTLLDSLIKEQKLVCSTYQGKRFYLRKFRQT